MEFEGSVLGGSFGSVEGGSFGRENGSAKGLAGDVQYDIIIYKYIIYLIYRLYLSIFRNSDILILYIYIYSICVSIGDPFCPILVVGFSG